MNVFGGLWERGKEADLMCTAAKHKAWKET